MLSKEVKTVWGVRKGASGMTAEEEAADKLLAINDKLIGCPPCLVEQSRPCRGGHVTRKAQCSDPPFSCSAACGRALQCTNHECALACHAVAGDENEGFGGMAAEEGSACVQCCLPCSKPRAVPCGHTCALACHPGDCPECAVWLKRSCHCGVSKAMPIKCHEMSLAVKKDRQQGCSTHTEAVLSCGHACQKALALCGHPCPVLCHRGECIPDNCQRKVTVRCPCRRQKEEWRCSQARGARLQAGIKDKKVSALLVCDSVCLETRAEEEQKAAELEEERLAEQRAETERAGDSAASFTSEVRGKTKQEKEKPAPISRAIRLQKFVAMHRYKICESKCPPPPPTLLPSSPSKRNVLTLRFLCLFKSKLPSQRSWLPSSCMRFVCSRRGRLSWLKWTRAPCNRPKWQKVASSVARPK